MTRPDSSWEQDAACRTADPEAWFPITGTGAPAIRICRQCPVRQACLDAAMAEENGLPVDHRHGIRGGLTRKQRYALARKTTLGEAA